MKILSTLIAILTLSSFSFGQTSSQTILDKLSKKMKSHNSFYVEFSANTKNTDTGTNSTETGKGWVKGNKFYASMGEIAVVSNGMKTWTIVKEEKSVYESDSDEDED